MSSLGYLVDRMSVNMELPTIDGLHRLAPHKKPEHIVKPIRQIQAGIVHHRLSIGKSNTMERAIGNQHLPHTIFKDNPYRHISQKDVPLFSKHSVTASGAPAPFAPAGQSTQMIIGATDENDLQLLTTTQKLYQQYDMKRVFFSAYVPINEDAALPPLDTPSPLLREHRLYQADWLLRFYGFHASELLSEQRPNFNIYLDPKCDWALRNLHLFPVEINTASFQLLLRVPGLGTKSAMRIIKARRQSHLDFCHLKKIGVVLKRAQYFITCSGKMLNRTPIEEDYITRQLIHTDSRQNWKIDHPDHYQQLTLFDTGLSRWRS